jgi:hypothetical protein
MRTTDSEASTLRRIEKASSALRWVRRPFGHPQPTKLSLSASLYPLGAFKGEAVTSAAFGD